MDTIALLFAFGAAVFWGTYLVPVKKVVLPERPYVLFMGMAMFLVVCAFPFILGHVIQDTYLFALGVLGGLTWGIGNLFSILAVRAIGISRSIPIFIFSLVVNAAWGIMMFKELKGGSILIMAGAVGLVMTGAMMAQMTGQTKGERGKGKRRSGTKAIKFGIAAAAITALFFGTYNAAEKAMDTDPLTGGVGLVLGTAIACTIIGLLWFDSGPFWGGADAKTAGLACLSGILWAIGTLFSIFAMDRIGLARTFPITTLNVIIYLGWGIFYYKEVPKGKIWITIVGTFILFMGVMVVASM